MMRLMASTLFVSWKLFTPGRRALSGTNTSCIRMSAFCTHLHQDSTQHVNLLQGGDQVCGPSSVCAQQGTKQCGASSACAASEAPSTSRRGEQTFTWQDACFQSIGAGRLGAGHTAGRFCWRALADDEGLELAQLAPPIKDDHHLREGGVADPALAPVQPPPTLHLPRSSLAG